MSSGMDPGPQVGGSSRSRLSLQDSIHVHDSNNFNGQMLFPVVFYEKLGISDCMSLLASDDRHPCIGPGLSPCIIITQSVKEQSRSSRFIIRERVRIPLQRSSYVWNSHPGALPILPQFSDVLRDFPFYLNHLGDTPHPKFTAVIYVSMAAHSAPLLRLVKTVAKSAYAARVVVIWNSETVPASSVKWPSSPIPINVIQAQHKLQSRNNVVNSTVKHVRSYGEALESDVVFQHP
ncbi:hypothetical protein TNCV_2942801 [Trichonephila clavipes]|nr:hypothetical protein TNCV_2942801 [Trichonephila clavipes]